LWSNQELLRAGIVDVKFIHVLKDRFEDISSNFDSFDVEVNAFTNQKHLKRRLRQSAYREICASGTWLDERTYSKGVNIKLKTGEYAKPNKPPRSIGDFGASAPLSGGWFVEACKEIFTAPLQVGSFTSTFIKKPSLSILDSVFDELINGTTNVAYVHSDDMCIGVQLPSGRAAFNIDISRCDSSNGTVIFDFVQDILSSTGHKDLAKSLVEQCTAMASVFDPTTKRRILKFKGKGPVQYSGTVLTTLNNNIASNLIISGISEMLPYLDNDTIESGIELGAALCGYKVTVERCKTYHDLQFLKHSPCRNVSGDVRATLNLGVVLRCLGQCDQDLPGRGCLEKRAYEFNCGLVQGMCHMGDHALHDTLRSKFRAPTKTIYPNYLLEAMESNQRPSGRIEIPELLLRYDLSIVEYEYMQNCILESGFGDRIITPASSIILKRDYGV
jgi:hypothetical protein